MSVTEVKQGLGRWTLSLRPTVPQEILDLLGDYFGHIAILEGRVNPAEYGDELLSAARYVGVYRSRRNDVDNRTHNVAGKYELSGLGMAFWLGDDGGKGEVLETPAAFAGQSFATVINSLLPASVQAGTVHSLPGTYTGQHQWCTPRQAIDYVCSTFSAEWRMNGDGTLDAGTVAQLYPATPQVMLIKRGYGRDLDLTAYQGKMDSGEDTEQYATRVVVLARGEGEQIATGSANVPATPYKDLFGNPIALTRLISESTTEAGNANARAGIELAGISTTRRALRLAASDFDIEGKLRVGHWVWVYDPDTGLYNTNYEIQWRGDRLNPARHRVVELTWPVTKGMTVALRNRDGDWFNLTDHVIFESGDVTITVGELPRSLTGGGGEPVGTRPSADTSLPGVPTWDTPFFTSSYEDVLGVSKAQIILTWNLPLNTDGTTILDGDHYEIQIGQHPATEWQTYYAAWGLLSILVQELSPGIAYDIRIRAVDRYGHTSAWSTSEQVTVAPDSTPPSTPAAPTVAASRIALQVSHTLGKSTGGTYNLEVDLDHLEIHVGASNSFTPDATTLKGRVGANAGMMNASVPAIVTVPIEETTLRWVRVIAVDIAGNKSPASTAASATALLIDNAHISDLTVSKLTAGTLNAAVLLAATIRTADSPNARIEINSGGIGAWNGGNIQTIAIASSDGSFFIRSSNSGARIDLSTANGLQLFNSSGVNTVTLSAAGVFTLRSATSGPRIEMDASGYRAYSSTGQTVDIASATGNVAIVGQISTGFSGRRIVFNPTGAAQPTIRFVPDSGTAYAVIEARAVGGGGLELHIDSQNDGTGRFSSMLFQPTWFVIDANKATSAGGSYGSRIFGAYDRLSLYFNQQAGTGIFSQTELKLDANGFYLTGKVNRVPGSDTAIIPGSVVASGSSGTILYGDIIDQNGFSYPVISPLAGNPVGHSVTSAISDRFSWSVTAALSGSDRITYWCIKA